MINSDQERDRQMDEALADSFPASDPPFFVGAGALPGPTQPKRRKPGDFGQDFGAIPHFKERRGSFYGDQ
jgi:hypothetical protein